MHALHDIVIPGNDFVVNKFFIFFISNLLCNKIILN